MSAECVVREFGFVGQDVRVCVRGHREIPLPNVLADPSPRDAAQVLERDPAVTEVPDQQRSSADVLLERALLSRVVDFGSLEHSVRASVAREWRVRKRR